MKNVQYKRFILNQIGGADLMIRLAQKNKSTN